MLGVAAHWEHILPGGQQQGGFREGFQLIQLRVGLSCVPAPPAVKQRTIPLELLTWNGSHSHTLAMLLGLQAQVTEGKCPQCPFSCPVTLVVSLQPEFKAFTRHHWRSQDVETPRMGNSTKGHVPCMEQKIGEAGGCGCTQSSHLMDQGLKRDTTS